MSDFDFTPYVEVQQVRIGLVNAYLRHGYKLLGLAGYAQSASHGEQPKEENRGNPQMYYTRRGTLYIVGRTAEVSPWEPPTKIARDQEAQP